MARRNKDFLESARKNNNYFSIYERRLTEIALSRFEWQNLPPTVNADYLERCLFAQGQAVFFVDPVLGPLALQALPLGGLDPYGLPVAVQAVAENGYTADLTNENSVLIYNNYLRTPFTDEVGYYANRLYNIDRIIDININAQKTPLLIRCDEKQRLAMKNLYMAYDGNQPVIYGDKDGLRENPVQVLSTNAPYLAGNLYELKTKIWYEALTALGVQNPGKDKKERLNVTESTQMEGATQVARFGPLAMRQGACNKINAMFELDIWCEYRDSATDMEGGEDE